MADGSTSVVAAQGSATHAFDCFYVYPTVSFETTPNADLQVQPGETGVAVQQASRFSQVCDVWAPMYHQLTWAGLAHTTAAEVGAAFNSVRAAWDDYLAHDNHGRPVVFIGHSQGAVMLIDLLRAEVDPSPTLRKQMVSAIILGGDLTVATGQGAGGAFTYIPACVSARQTGCVIAYSSFLEQPPANTGFGKPGQGTALLWGETATVGQQVLCVNPAALGGGSGTLHPDFLVSQQPRQPGVTTPWVTYPGLYTGTCDTSGGTTWLQVQPSTAPNDNRPRQKEVAGPTWGLHGDDVNIAIDDLVNDVAQEEAAYR